ncbi:hypothetical protein MUS1_13280 [Marinomonas ushuaiensis DSM 15871]|uniref:Uncharacterized protein n=1 Tax=Marinomonas ushuaiensis DSM 15871 TaxID=1122207 RepID=X7E704_9GAMM|nr:hypothetical protein MUS1_13280 [Marinomonas ushuaiensis DSM 15871]
MVGAFYKKHSKTALYANQRNTVKENEKLLDKSIKVPLF